MRIFSLRYKRLTVNQVLVWFNPFVQKIQDSSKVQVGPISFIGADRLSKMCSYTPELVQLIPSTDNLCLLVDPVSAVTVVVIYEDPCCDRQLLTVSWLTLKLTTDYGKRSRSAGYLPSLYLKTNQYWFIHRIAGITVNYIKHRAHLVAWLSLSGFVCILRAGV